LELLLSWLIFSVAAWLTPAILPGFHVNNFGTAVLAPITCTSMGSDGRSAAR